MRSITMIAATLGLALGLTSAQPAAHAESAPLAGAPPAGHADSGAPAGGVPGGRPVVNKAITVRDAVEIALKESPVIRGAEEEVNMAVAQARMARAATLPTLSATATLSGGQGGVYGTPAPVMPTNLTIAPRGAFFGGNLSLMFPLYTGGRLQALVRKAQAMQRASGAELGVLQRDLALEVKTTYRQVLLAQAVTGIFEDLNATAQERLRIDRISFEAGRIPKLYVLRDEAEAADAGQNLLNAQRDVDVSLIMLKTAMGLSQASQITLSEQLGYEPFPRSKEELLAQAVRQRPELQAAASRIAGAREDIAAARGAFLPQVSLAAMGDTMRERGMPWSTGVAAGVVVGIPLLDGGMRRAQVSEARAGERRAEQERERVALQVTQDVETAFVSLRAAEKGIKTAEAALAAAEENYRVAQLRYTEGRSINVEVLDALTAYTRARTNHVQALFDYNVARDRLQRAAGEL